MEHSAAITIFGIISVFIAALLFYILAIFLGLLFKNRNVKAEEEISKAIEDSKTKEEDLLDDTELVAVITSSISAYMGNGRFVIKSIKESKTPIWGMVDRLGDNI